MRIVFIIIGIIFTILGLIGVAIPVLPQIPFFVIAIVAFCNVSVRLKRWIRERKLYQKHFAMYAERFMDII